MPFPLFERRLFDASECSELARGVRSLCELTVVHDDVMSTVVLPAYLCSDDSERYKRTAEATNRRLWNEFSACYERLAVAIEQWLESRVRFAFDLALPGFHLFTLRAHARYDGGMAHFDLPHRQIGWRANIEDDRCLSFTLPIELPQSGSGLDAWPYWYPNPQPLDAVHVLGEPTFHFGYRAGQLVVTDGRQLHRIAPFCTEDKPQSRITLQGHLVRSQGQWVAFW